DGIVTEGTHTNVFGVVDGELRTHPASPYVLPGITRAVVIELAAALGLPLRESPMLLDELRSASELFLTGTTTDVMPIVRVDGRLVGEGRPGPVAARLHAALYTRINDLAAVEAVR
ncbi:MAG: aminotransferase class IV, partial [Gemmatimonadaceae bacterium]